MQRFHRTSAGTQLYSQNANPRIHYYELLFKATFTKCGLPLFFGGFAGWLSVAVSNGPFSDSCVLLSVILPLHIYAPHYNITYVGQNTVYELPTFLFWMSHYIVIVLFAVIIPAYQYLYKLTVLPCFSPWQGAVICHAVFLLSDATETLRSNSYT